MVSVSRIVSVTSIIYLVFIFAFASGTIHAIIEGKDSPQQLFLIRDRTTQTLSEAVLSTMVLFLGVGGIYFVHRSTRPQTAKAQKVYFVAGFSIVGISLLGVTLLVNFKL